MNVEYPAWQPITADQMAHLLQGFNKFWWIAGGWAIELLVGHPIRPHGDIDISLLRRDQEALQHTLCDWDLWVAEPPGEGSLRPWARDEILQRPLHDIWCREKPGYPWQLQIMLEEADGDLWISRRNPQVRRLLGELGWTTTTGIPVLSPEIQFFYKAKKPRLIDLEDFHAALPHLSPKSRAWLDEVLAVTYPDHQWRDEIALATGSVAVRDYGHP